MFAISSVLETLTKTDKTFMRVSEVFGRRGTENKRLINGESTILGMFLACKKSSAWVWIEEWIWAGLV